MSSTKRATAPVAEDHPTPPEEKGQSPIKFAIVVFLLPLLLAIAAGFWAR